MMREFSQTFTLLSISCTVCFHLRASKSDAENMCRSGWTPYSSRSCVKAHEIQETHFKAREDCMSAGGDLVKILNATSNQFIHSKLIEPLNTKWRFWIGLNKKTATFFRWGEESEEATYVSWASGQPDEDADCVSINYDISPNWWDDRCDWAAGYICEIFTECRSGTYGKECLKRCSEHCEGIDKACSNKTGTCLNGCDVGYHGAKCDTECNTGTYGRNCLQRCSENCGGEDNACSTTSGTCLYECDLGYKGAKCETECATGTFGRNCLQFCSQNCGGLHKNCDSKNGSCSLGCAEGYGGVYCEKECNTGTYGSNCLQQCSENCGGEDNACSTKNGTCLYECDLGYKGAWCDTECGTGTFGKNCLQKCSKNCRGLHKNCDSKNGSCLLGCSVGYGGVYCEQNITESHKPAVQDKGQGLSILFIVGVVCMGPVLLCLGLVVVLIERQFKKSDDSTEDSNSSESTRYTESSHEHRKDEHSEEAIKRANNGPTKMSDSSSSESGSSSSSSSDKGDSSSGSFDEKISTGV